MSAFKVIAILSTLIISSPSFSQNSEDTLKIHQSIKESFRDYNFKKSLIVSGAFIGLGVIALSENEILSNEEYAEERNEHLPEFRTGVDDYLQYAPIAAVYGLNIFGIKGKNNFGNRTALLLKSEILSAAIVWTLKYTTREERPDRSNHRSFPSGHTAQAFTAATFMSKEYGDLSPWYSIGAYTAAASVGALRILNNKHYVSDVLVGAGIGILSTNIVYATHKYKWSRNANISIQIVPTYDQGNIGLYGKVVF